MAKELSVGDKVTIKWTVASDNWSASRFAGSRGKIKEKGKIKPIEYVVSFSPVSVGLAELERSFTEEDFIGYGDYK